MKPSHSFTEGSRARALGLPIGVNIYPVGTLHYLLFRAGWAMVPANRQKDT